MFFVSFFYVICKISNLAQASCTELTLRAAALKSTSMAYNWLSIHMMKINQSLAWQSSNSKYSFEISLDAIFDGTEFWLKLRRLLWTPQPGSAKEVFIIFSLTLLTFFHDGSVQQGFAIGTNSGRPLTQNNGGRWNSQGGTQQQPHSEIKEQNKH